jgi:hypothetical protein
LPWLRSKNQLPADNETTSAPSTKSRNDLLANLETSKTRNANILADYRNRRRNIIVHRLVLTLYKRLLQQTNLLIRLVKFSLDNFIDCVLRFTLRLHTRNLLFIANNIGRNIFAGNVSRVRRCNMHANIAPQFLKLRLFSDKIDLAI